MSYTCPVCGFPDLKELPRGKGGGGSYEICPSCGFQFGISDDDCGMTYARWRAKWRAEGMRWTSRQPQPPGWDPAEQLNGVEGRRSEKPRGPRRG